MVHTLSHAEPLTIVALFLKNPAGKPMFCLNDVFRTWFERDEQWASMRPLEDHSYS
jgi:hypothetical protein